MGVFLVFADEFLCGGEFHADATDAQGYDAKVDKEAKPYDEVGGYKVGYLRHVRIPFYSILARKR
jgi:hypothetical protein